MKQLGELFSKQHIKLSRRARRRLKVLLAEAGFIFVAFIVLLIVYKTSYFKRRVAEAGAVVTASDFVRNGSKSAAFAEGSAPFDTSVPGTYSLKIKNGIFTYDTELVVEDTIAPEGIVRQIEIRSGESVSPEMFFAEISDHTAVTASFEKEPNLSLRGRQEINLRLTDLAGNHTSFTSSLIVTDVLYSLTIEVGESVPDVMSFCGAVKDASFVTDVRSINTMVTGEHDIRIFAEGEEHVSTLKIIDTVSPVLSLHDVEDYRYVIRHPEDFVTACDDMSPCTLTFASEPDVSLVGTQTVTVIATDSSGNSSSASAKLTLCADNLAPIINGAKYRIFHVGDIITYMNGVSVYDNNPTGLSLAVDSSRVMTTLPGTYRVVYTARDAEGNESSRTVEYTIVPRNVTDEYVYDMVDELLGVLLSDRMDEMEKLYSIYDYVAGLFTRSADSQKDDPVLACYEGLTKRKGDSYTVACTLRLLLERAGFDADLIASERYIPPLVNEDEQTELLTEGDAEDGSEAAAGADDGADDGDESSENAADAADSAADIDSGDGRTDEPQDRSGEDEESAATAGELGEWRFDESTGMWVYLNYEDSVMREGFVWDDAAADWQELELPEETDQADFEADDEADDEVDAGADDEAGLEAGTETDPASDTGSDTAAEDGGEDATAGEDKYVTDEDGFIIIEDDEFTDEDDEAAEAADELSTDISVGDEMVDDGQSGSGEEPVPFVDPYEIDPFEPIYWVLVDIYGSRFHIDACPRYDKARIFLWNDDLMTRFSEYDDHSHYFDHDHYQRISPDEEAYRIVYGDDFSRDYRQTLYPGNRIEKIWEEEGYDW